MKKLIMLFSCFCLLALPTLAFADAYVNEWIGEWDMNHDGWKVTLIITESKVDCASSPWCALVLKYKDAKGKSVTGKIDKIDQKFQHMTFYLDFPNNTQKFDVYLFSWDKKKMAGITYWGGKTFGLFAIKP